MDGYIQIPGIWNGFEANGTVLGGEGYATYRFRILVSKDDLYGIKIKEFDCAYNIWVNDKYKGSVGRVGIDKENNIPDWRRHEVYFESKNKQIEVVIQVSNFHHRKGGAEDVMVFGKEKSIYNYKLFLLGRDVFLFGIFLIMTIFHLLIYLFRRKDRTVALFSLLCFFMTLRLITTNEKILLGMFPTIDWTFAVRLEYLSYTLMVPSFYSFIRHYYPQVFKKAYSKLWVFWQPFFL